MRKFFVASLGVFLLSGVFMFTSDARTTGNSCGCFVQQDVDPKARYQGRGIQKGSCCSYAQRKTRVFSDRIGTWRASRHRSRCQNCGVQTLRSSIPGRPQAYKYSQYRKSNLTRAQKLAFQRRIFGNHNGGRTLNTVTRNHSDRHVVRNGNYNLKSDNTINQALHAYKMPENFTLGLPGNFTKKDGIFRSNDSSLAFRVVSGGKCNAIAFNSCVSRLNRNFEKTSNLRGVYGVQSFHRWNQTILSDFGYFQTVTQSFDAQSKGRNNSYFTFTAMDPETGQITRIEGVANSRERARAAQQMHEIFETFRFKI